MLDQRPAAVSFDAAGEAPDQRDHPIAPRPPAQIVEAVLRRPPLAGLAADGRGGTAALLDRERQQAACPRHRGPAAARLGRGGRGSAGRVPARLEPSARGEGAAVLVVFLSALESSLAPVGHSYGQSRTVVAYEIEEEIGKDTFTILTGPEAGEVGEFRWRYSAVLENKELHTLLVETRKAGNLLLTALIDKDYLSRCVTKSISRNSAIG